MSVSKHRNKWRAEVWVGSMRITGKSGFATKADAKKWHDCEVVRYHANPEKVGAEKAITFCELLERFEKIHFPTIAVETRKRYRVDIDLRIREFFRYRALDKIAPSMVEAFRAEIMGNLSAKSVNNCMDLVKTIFRKAVEWDLIAKNPVRLKRLKLPEIKYAWWDKEEDISAFLREAKKTRYYAAYKIALECGLRVGEIVGLSKQDVDLDRCQIHIHRQWLDKQFCYGPTKGRRERYVNFNPKSDLREALRETINASPDPEVIFVTSTGRRVLSRKIGGDIFYRILKRAQVPRIRFHDLRHTFASWYMKEVDDIWSLKGIMGHVDVQTTQRYAHLSKKHQKRSTLNFIPS